MSNTYIAVTIGPIYDTIAEAKRTRSVWASSYFFSWFMRRLLERCKENDMQIFLPYSEQLYTAAYGSGFYADRLYFIKDNHTTKEKISEIAAEIMLEIETLSEKKLSRSFLNSYINLHIIEKQIEERDLENTYTLAILNSILDNRELNKKAPFSIEINNLQDFIGNKLSDNFLAKDAFRSNTDARNFRSVAEIATTTLLRSDKAAYQKALRKDFKNVDIELIDELAQSFDVFPYHKYYAVLYADGDNIGKLLQVMEDKKQNVKDFSKALFEFGVSAEEIIYSLGGNGIYLGGEDILAFLPVACIDENAVSTHTFLSVIAAIDQAFDKTVVDLAEKYTLPVPTLSYGVMISYIKHPLKETMQKAHQLLEDAKKVNGKNAIAIHFQKHSGQFTNCIIEKNNVNSCNAIYQLMERFAANINSDTNEILNSIIHQFKNEMFFSLFYIAAKENRLESFLENFFNEDIHRNETAQNAFLKTVKSLAEDITKDYGDAHKSNKILYTVLRLIQFINSKKEH